MLAERVSAVSQVLLGANPMSLGSLGPDEYEPEALSITARLAEACIDKQSPEAQRKISGIVLREALEFWFGRSLPESALSELAAAILSAYLGPEQVKDPEVHSGQ